jgi:hydrogenase expression/formation protein HypC
MCLGVPGRIVSVREHDDPLQRAGRVEFGGVIKEVSLAYVPEAAVGDYVVVHVGFAISRLDEAQARETFTYLEEMGALEELAEDGAAAAASTTGGGRG